MSPVLLGADALGWVGTWMMAPSAPDSVEPRAGQFILENETVRQIVHLSIGGAAVKLRFSNTFGAVPLQLRSVFVAPRVSGDGIEPSAGRTVSFAGQSQVTIAPGATVSSDVVDMPVTSDSDLAVTFFVPQKLEVPAIHYTALQTSYVAKGDQSTARTLDGPRKITLDLILTGVEVATRTSPGAIVALGSSTTDGAHSTPNANHRWTDYLAARLRATRGDNAYSVLNAGISGNRVLRDGRGAWGPIFGQSAVARFSRDVLAQPGLRYVFLFEGGNDIRTPASTGEAISAKQLIMGFQLLARTAHENHVKIILGTITAFEGTNGDHDDSEWEETQRTVNQWIRTTHDIDGFADFDAAVRNPLRPARLLPEYDSGDHLHPNDAGYKAMADSIDLTLFEESSRRH
ncbi:SGNH/GDSL hydrolase family protein [Granulicella arctica]|uniref:Lysophospholipase L1-like esterase n=1 Tax=Granulicella arctica TaxID=940613 RepID=A0A7Y9TH69_9BACT|nr:SGNH/GDSL hydrolase family protein [Granulicella arctica]NYF79555.1 lysophospholipase L1-like esterase [Granulicella arctica]